MKIFITVGTTLILLSCALPAAASGGGGIFGFKDSHPVLNQVLLALNLALFVFLLAKLIGKPLGGFLDSRREAIGKELEDAQRKLAEAEVLRTQVLARLDQVEEEVSELRQRAERDGAAEAQRIEQQAKAESERFLTRVDDEIKRRHAETRQSLAEETAALTAQLTRELLAKEMTEVDRKRVLERSLDALKALEKES